MEAWTDLYQELVAIVKQKLPQIEWQDLWHDQVSYLTEELPFPTPALFYSFNIKGCDDKGLLIQDCDTQIDMYLFFETFGDTYDGSHNQAGASSFLSSLTDLHKAFHGKSGTNFGTLRRVALKQEESGGAGNLYRISFESNIEDASAQAEYSDQTVNDITVDLSSTSTQRPTNEDDSPLYHIQT